MTLDDTEGRYTDIHEGCVKTKRGHQNDSAAVDNGNFQYCHSLVLRIFTGTEARPKTVSYRPVNDVGKL